MTGKLNVKGNTHGKTRGVAKNECYVLLLYVAGLTPRSSQAIQSIKKTCDEYLAGRYEIEIVNINDHPALARSEQIIAAPTLVKKLPLPLRRLIGDMTDRKKLLAGLDLVIKPQADEDGHDAS